jgi:hypothetical protein
MKVNMNEAVAKATRRELRRAVGEEARGIVNEHTALIDNAIIPQLKAHEARQDYHERQIAVCEDRLMIVENEAKERWDYMNTAFGNHGGRVAAFINRGFLARLRWIFRGR